MAKAKTTFEALKQLKTPEDLAKIILHFQRNARTLPDRTYSDLLFSTTEWLKGDRTSFLNKLLSMSDYQLIKDCEDTEVEKEP